MKKKLIVTLCLVFAFLFTSAVGFAIAGMLEKKHPSDYKIGITYEEAMQSDKPSVALFYVDWCGFCLRFMPRYQVLSTMYKNKYNFVMINCEDPKYKKVVADALIEGFPTVYILDAKYDNKIHLTQGLYANVGKFKEELDRYLRIRSMLDKENAAESK